MKALFFSTAALGVFLLLPANLPAQGTRPVIVPDSRYPGAPAYPSSRHSAVLYELQCLESTTQTLYMSYVAYCKRLKVASNSADGQLLRAMIDLNQDVSRLAVQIRAHCNNSSLPLGAAYRAFHLAEYASRDSQWMAVQAGYVRSMFPYFQDLDQHLEEIGRMGYRNPMLRRLEMDGRYSGRFSGAPERHIALPPVPSLQPPPSVPAPQPRYRHEHGDDKIDLGDILKQLFRNKLN